MAWTLKFDPSATKQLAKLDKPVSRLIIRVLEEKLAGTKDPRKFGEALTGGLRGYWRYRIGDYRVICELRDHELLVWVVAIGHRREIYR